jgi:hypothetical protein
MLKKHFPGVHHHDRDEVSGKSDEPHPSISDKLGHVWKNHVKPTFLEALADLSITKNAIKTDFIVRKDIHDANLFH